MKGPVILALSLVLFACATAPYTGRRQLVLLSHEDEAALGAQAYAEVKATATPSANAAWSAMVTRAGQRIAAVADAP